MASIQTGIELQDSFTSVMYGIIGAMNDAVYAASDLQSAMSESVNHSPYDDIQSDVEQMTDGIEQATREQDDFNKEMQRGASHANDLMDAIKGAVATYATIQTLGNVIELSDDMTQTSARLDLIVDDGGSVEELENKIYASAQNARGDYLATADAVSKMGMQASQAFSSNDELIEFTELLNKQFVNAGTSAQGIDSVMLQLTQSMAAGKLQGEELGAVLDNAAPIVQNIQKYLEEVEGIDASNIKELASDGVITADIIKNSMFYAADEINAKFETMPMTWGQVWQSFQNTAVKAFQPVLERINDMANSEALNTTIENTVAALAIMAGIVLNIFELIGAVGQFASDNWSIIEPLIIGVAVALGLYTAALVANSAAQGINSAVKGFAAFQASVHAAALMMESGATFTATAAQHGFNAALLACPLTWIIILIIALIAIIYAVCAAIAKLTGVATSGFGVICGGVNVVIQFFKNLGLTVANIALGIGNAIAALASNMMTAFHNAICNIQSWFYNLLSTGLTVIEGICAALNKLPFVEFDYSGISNAADDYAAKAAEAAGNKEEYKSISDAFNEGFSTFDTFQDGWISDAFNAGAAWGDGIADKVSDFSISDIFGATDIPNPDDYSSAFSDAINGSGATGNLDDIAGNTGSIKDSLDVTQEELKYMRDIAEQESINRFTTAEIKIEQTNNNNISSDMDLDGIISGLADAVDEASEILVGKGD